jgi:hypothetical protein
LIGSLFFPFVGAFMRTILSMFCLIAAGAPIGCAPAVVVEAPVLATSEHHGGILIPLTDKQAYLELLNGKLEKKGKGYETSLVAYLPQPDQKSPFSETPASVEVKIGTPTGDQVVALKSAPDSADPLGTARFVSKPGPFELTQSGGEVTVKIGGQTLSGTFRGPR